MKVNLTGKAPTALVSGTALKVVMLPLLNVAYGIVHVPLSSSLPVASVVEIVPVPILSNVPGLMIEFTVKVMRALAVISASTNSRTWIILVLA